MVMMMDDAVNVIKIEVEQSVVPTNNEDSEMKTEKYTLCCLTLLGQ